MSPTSLATVLVVISATSFADAPLEPREEITQWSSNRRFCAVADPARDRVAVYRVEARTRTELWDIHPWQRSVAVSDDGEYLVACYSGLNLLPLDYRPEWKMLEFYHHGALIRSWTLAELVLDRSKLRRTASHFEWGACVGFDSKNRFEVRTVDQGAILFNAATGSPGK
jgi:hypothetical protein